jgi:heavy metal translocating P-type ATPase
MKRFLRAIRAYPHVFIVTVAIIASLVLDLSNQDKWAHLILGVTAALSTLPLLAGMWRTLRDGQFGVDVLAITAIVTSVLLHEYWAAIIICLMLTGGEALEDYADRRANAELSSLLERAPQKAHLLKGKTETDVPVSKIVVGDKLIIKAGEVVPVDAEILEGSSSVDESSLTGESLPVAKHEGDQLLSGSVTVDGTLVARALHTASDSQYQQIIKLVRIAQNTPAPFVRMADRYSVPFTALAFFLAGVAWAASGDAIRFLQVIVVATPCPLLLGAPIAIISGMSRAARAGVIVKTGAGLEKLASARTIAFDKTGTLTLGRPKVSSIKTYGSFKKDEVVAYAAAVEMGSNHILARAVIAYAEKTGTKIPKARNSKETAGGGLTATVQGKIVRVGTARYLEEAGIRVPKEARGGTHAFVAVHDKLAGYVDFVDEIRPESKHVLSVLKQLGIKHTLMVTGDNQKVAAEVAKQLGITEFTAEALPGDKLQRIEQVEVRPVAFIGDGVNDAPVLTAADVGVALGARGSTAASETADVVILRDDLTRVSEAVAIARRTVFIARQSILIGIFMSIVLMVIFSTGKFKPVYGAAIQELVDVTVIINALRAHSKKSLTESL